MSDIYGDVVVPSELCIPTKNYSEQPNKAGCIVLSGTKLFFHDGTGMKLITSA